MFNVTTVQQSASSPVGTTVIAQGMSSGLQGRDLSEDHQNATASLGGAMNANTGAELNTDDGVASVAKWLGHAAKELPRSQITDRRTRRAPLPSCCRGIESQAFSATPRTAAFASEEESICPHGPPTILSPGGGTPCPTSPVIRDSLLPGDDAGQVQAADAMKPLMLEEIICDADSRKGQARRQSSSSASLGLGNHPCVKDELEGGNPP